MARSGAGRFQELLSQVAEEHALETAELRAEIDRLRALLGHALPPPAAVPSLREAGVRTPAAEPPKVHQGDLHTDGSLVEVMVHGAGGFSEALLQATDSSVCQLCFSVGLEEVKSEWMPLQRDAWVGMPNMVGGEQTWEAQLITPCTMGLRVPSISISDEIYVELYIQERKAAVASACVTVGAKRKKWSFDNGGFLDAEILVDGKHTFMAEKESDRGSKEVDPSDPKSLTIKATTRARLQKIFKVDDASAKMVVPKDLQKALKSSKKNSNTFSSQMDWNHLEELIHELKRIHGIVFEGMKGSKDSKPSKKQPSSAAVIAWKSFMDCLLLENLPNWASGQVSLRLFILQKALLGDELPSIQASRALVRAYEQVKTPVTASHRIVLWITLVSTIFIFLSFILVGVALDYAPNWFGWKWVDSFFGVFFILESLLKICAMGPRTYFCGREKWWNLFDSGISLAALAELIYNLVSRGIENTMPTRIALTLRVLRLARVSFYMKLIQTPLLQELANIVQGFLVAVPSLFWVLVTLSVVIYVAALAMRATVAQLSSDLQSLGAAARAMRDLK
ncbi:Ion_trans domain-containing protein [Durusdinium trenchii]|uniref:Ion_trans domain-containing protein n=1 Tax=Durusdinium trenchii TaxID=1381693 RepID=A0ABP0IUU4_9DINO